MKLASIALPCIGLVLVRNLGEFMFPGGNSKRPWLLDVDGLRGAVAPSANHPDYVLQPKQSFIELPNRTYELQKDLVKPGDYIYFLDPLNWDSSPIVIPSHKLVFFTIPKVGCTVWKQLFRRMMGQEDWLSQDAKRGLPHNPNTNQLLYLYNFSLEEASEIMSSPNWMRAIMVRDPKQRFLSAFLDKAVSNDHHHIYDRCCHEDNSLLDMRHCQEAEYSAAGFLRLAVICHDQHWTPQHERVDFKYWPYMDHVLHVETAAYDAKVLLQTVNSWDDATQQWISAWDSYGKTGWGKDGASSIFESQSIEAAGEHATWAHDQHWKWLTPQIEMKVETFYQADYENPLFNFTRGLCLTCT